MSYFFQGITIGLAYVAPIGLQNLFVINSALTSGRGRAFITALIVIFFDVTLALACFFGMGYFIQRYEIVQEAILLIGSLIVIYIGFTLLRSKEEELKLDRNKVSIGKTIYSACVVTWFNPQALIDGTMLLGAFRANLPTEHSTMFILGANLASFIWFIGLSMLISTFSKYFTSKVVYYINLICGAVIVFYGLKLFWNFMEHFI